MSQVPDPLFFWVDDRTAMEEEEAGAGLVALKVAGVGRRGGFFDVVAEEFAGGEESAAYC